MNLLAASCTAAPLISEPNALKTNTVAYFGTALSLIHSHIVLLDVTSRLLFVITNNIGYFCDEIYLCGNELFLRLCSIFGDSELFWDHEPGSSIE